MYDILALKNNYKEEDEERIRSIVKQAEEKILPQIDIRNWYETGEAIRCEETYRKSFVDKDGFEGNRFERYVRRTTKFIMEHFGLLYIEFFIECPDNYDFNKLMIDYFQTLYSGKEHGEHIAMLCSAVKNYTTINYDEIANKDFIMEFINNPYKEGINLDYLITKETRNACKEFIRLYATEDFTINESNYFKTLANKPQHVIFLFNTIANAVKIDIGNLCCSTYEKYKAEKVDKDIEETLRKRIYELEEENKKIISDLEESKKESEKLTRQLKEKKEPKEDNRLDEISEENMALERQNIKIKERYNKLLQKYEALKNKQSDIDVMPEEQERPMEDIDKYGKYLFVMYDDIPVKNALKEEFPNASFTNSSININTTLDLVIVMTTCIDHSTYYKVKEQCKNKNIPIIHANFSNIKLIKELIWTALNT